MRYMHANEMKDMPDGTMFIFAGDEETGLRIVFDKTMIFRGNMRKSHTNGAWDWDEEDLVQIESDLTDEFPEKEFLMVEERQSVPLEPGASFSRNGMYPTDPRFWVFEPADVLRLQEYIGKIFEKLTAGMSGHEKLAIRAEAKQ